jgi:anthranilate phosphoribosyltransferase
MDLSSAIKRLSGRTAAERHLSEREAGELLAAMLDEGAPDLELGALLALLEGKPVTPAELLGYCNALSVRCNRLGAPKVGARAVSFAAYHGARGQPHLLPLVAMSLQRLGVPVLVHGTLESAGGVAAAYVFRELDVFPCATLSQAGSRLEQGRVAFVPAGVLAPGLFRLLALRARLGFGAYLVALARLLAPFGPEEALQVVSSNAVAGGAVLREVLLANGARALLFEGVEGEAYADPRRRPQFEFICAGESRVLFAAESAAQKRSASLPPAADARAVAAWTRRALAGEVPLPQPLVNQIACCLYGSGRTLDMNQAKAIVAVETGVLAA